jgi:hypothetical protein
MSPTKGVALELAEYGASLRMKTPLGFPRILVAAFVENRTYREVRMGSFAPHGIAKTVHGIHARRILRSKQWLG